MKKNTAKTLFLTALATAMLSFPAAASHSPDGTGHDIAIKVNGLVCDFCAQSIKTLFGKQAGITNVGVDLDHGLVTLDLENGTTIGDDVITGIITDSGYTITDISYAKKP